jgi:hypothetical protein
VIIRPQALLLVLAALLTIGVSGCFLTADREINLDIVYPSARQSEVTVKYRVPPPPDGKVYVLWIMNPDAGNLAKIGRLPPSSRLSAVKVSVDFFATGAIVSIESSPDVTQMGETWALEGGKTAPSTPVPAKSK